MKKKMMHSIASAAMIVAVPAFAQGQPATDRTGNACDRLAAHIEENQGRDFGIDRRQLANWRAVGDTRNCEEALRRVGADAERETDGQIVVEQNAPSVRIDRAEPRITVRQPRPDVSVLQGRPDILVQQPAPQVTIDIPQPRITVRMPEPQVNVAQSRPQVSVEQPEPDVQVVQPDRPAQVLTERGGEPEVRIVGSESGAGVDIRSADQPRVRYQAEEPQIRINRAEGQPEVRYEQAATGETGGGRTEQAFAGASGDGQEATGAVSRPQMRRVSLEQIDGMDVVNARGQQLGDVETLVVAGDGSPFAVISHGGFLGLGEKRVAFPLENMVMTGDRLVIRGLTEDEVRAMPSYREGSGNYRALGEGRQAEIEVAG